MRKDEITMPELGRVRRAWEAQARRRRKKKRRVKTLIYRCRLSWTRQNALLALFSAGASALSRSSLRVAAANNATAQSKDFLIQNQFVQGFKISLFRFYRRSRGRPSRGNAFFCAGTAPPSRVPPPAFMSRKKPPAQMKKGVPSSLALENRRPDASPSESPRPRQGRAIAFAFAGSIFRVARRERGRLTATDGLRRCRGGRSRA